MIIFILVAFLLSTALTSIMYLSNNKNAETTTGENLTGIVDEVVVEETPVIEDEAVVEEMPIIDEIGVVDTEVAAE